MDDAREQDLVGLISGSEWFMRVLEAAQAVDAPDWWIGGGVLRNLVWDGLHGSFDPAGVKDVDLAFFDPEDLSRDRDQQVEAALRERAPDVAWDAKNQAAVHTWYSDRFGIDVDPLRSTADGVGTWPETATAVAVRLHGDGQVQITAPYGLADLLGGICRRNPRRVTVEEYTRRLERHQVQRRWPRVQVVRDPPPVVDTDSDR